MKADTRARWTNVNTAVACWPNSCTTDSTAAARPASAASAASAARASADRVRRTASYRRVTHTSGGAIATATSVSGPLWAAITATITASVTTFSATAFTVTFSRAWKADRVPQEPVGGVARGPVPVPGQFLGLPGGEQFPPHPHQPGVPDPHVQQRVGRLEQFLSHP